MLFEQARSLLEARFGHESFRSGQADVVQHILNGDDVLAVMPSGSGKSLCFQLPAIMSEGLTVVISPLIALMRDQVSALRCRGISAAMLSSVNDEEEDRAVHGGIAARRLKLLYMSPERFAQRGTLDLMVRARVRRIVVDEAHCLSHWGHDFRPDYALVGDVCAELRPCLGHRGLQIVAVTATADRLTREDILAQLFTRPPQVLIRSFDRPNIHLCMEPRRQADRQIKQFVGERPGEAGIVYCATRRHTEAMGSLLSAAGHAARIYHAGLSNEEREAAGQAFRHEPGIIIVATIAFGMGVDRADIRFVCHADTPSSIETYYQEIGRAGRDGKLAHTLCLFDSRELQRRSRPLDRHAKPDTVAQAAHLRTLKLKRLCRVRGCRRVELLAHFDEASAPCGNCDRCDENWLQKALTGLRLR
jgi:ATP-dependent DNA helicase RecQ